MVVYSKVAYRLMILILQRKWTAGLPHACIGQRTFFYTKQPELAHRNHVSVAVGDPSVPNLRSSTGGDRFGYRIQSPVPGGLEKRSMVI